MSNKLLNGRLFVKYSAHEFESLSGCACLDRESIDNNQKEQWSHAARLQNFKRECSKSNVEEGYIFLKPGQVLVKEGHYNCQGGQTLSKIETRVRVLNENNVIKCV